MEACTRVLLQLQPVEPPAGAGAATFLAVQTNRTQPINTTWEQTHLHSELMRPVCLDKLKNTTTTKECLYHFFADCVVTALRGGNKECPTHQKENLVSKRSLRSDLNFDYEAHQEKALARINKHNPQQQTKTSDDSGLELDNSNAKVVSDPVMDIYMKSSGNATDDHLSKHLAVRLFFSLELVSEKYWKVNKLMELHYAPTKEHK
ncbi:hypothetical protein FD755_023656 [Muntiacus reevesi]|uniref:RING-type E3 ubiquitin transferase n=1 Tax=Muntiacus reevesi TaxID=9886 RepID=A0A5N3VZV0_MUNRE|nr:hypothetical protein FD755_023656 [Muntiacus reevesi]